MKTSFIVGIASFAGGSLAQATIWGQCGGIGWTGSTTCVSGSYCAYQNAYYSQCLPGTASTTASKPLTTSSSTTAHPSTKTTTTMTGSSSSTRKPTSTSSPPSSGTGFPSADGTLFDIDGKTSYYAGTNCYWCSFLTLSSDVGTALDGVQQSGLKILRVWGFYDVTTPQTEDAVYFQYLSTSGSTINTGTYGLQLLDNVVSAAEARGIKLIINFVNNWSDYGGIPAYVTVFGGTAETWYTNDAAQAQYRTYIEAVVSRYIDSDAILAWELCNEPRCHGCDTDVIYNWATNTSAYVKSLDSKHMVTLGDEGFGLPGDGSYPYTYEEGVDWQTNLGIDTLDFGTFHFYPDSWGVTDDFGNGWVEAHAGLCEQAGKPCYFEEYGSTTNHCSVESVWQQTSLSLAGEGMAGDSFWQYGTTVSWGQTPNDGYTVYYNTSDWTCLVTDHVAAI